MCQPDLPAVTLQRKESQPRPPASTQLSRCAWDLGVQKDRGSQLLPGVQVSGSMSPPSPRLTQPSSARSLIIPEVFPVPQTPRGREGAEKLRGLAGEEAARGLHLLPSLAASLLLRSVAFGLEHVFREKTECSHPPWCKLPCQWTGCPSGSDPARS